ncbi:MAG: hypothetical protein K6A41_05680 [Bacteroidales bacterium]|nr:hypothetical protein [Bacteroidales bacterium]
MKKIPLLLSILLIAHVAQSQIQQIDYLLSWKGDGLGVTVTVKSDQDTLLFTYATDNGGFTDQMSWFQDLTVSKGRVEVAPNSRQLTVLPVKGNATFSYTVRCTLPKGYGSPGGCLWDMFRPDIDDKMLFSRTENIFAVPQDGDEIPVSVKWKSLPDYPVFCMYNPGKGTGPFRGKVSDIAESVMAGDSLLTVDTVLIDGHLHYMVTALRKSPEKNKADLKAYFKTFYDAITDFWEYEYDGPYSMLFFPFRENTFEMTGNGFSNGFLSRYDATEDTILTIGRRDLFTHEVGHKWLSDGSAWFSEGFNEMQTAYQIVASGLDDPAYFATYFNVALEGLYHNPHRNVTGEEADERFWDDGSYIWLLYWRGFNYAFHLAGVYEHETGNPNAWKAMMKEVKPFLNDFTPEKFLDAMSRLMDRDRLLRDYEKYIVKGENFVFTPENLPSGCAIVTQEDGSPQLIITDSALFAKHFR